MIALDVQETLHHDRVLKAGKGDTVGLQFFHRAGKAVGMLRYRLAPGLQWRCALRSIQPGPQNGLASIPQGDAGFQVLGGKWILLFPAGNLYHPMLLAETAQQIP
ncbi:hypothetical protein [Thiolapillus sp.]